MGMAGYLIRKYRNHPSIVLWVSNHNHGGAWGDQNPLRIGGEYKRANARQERETKEKARNNFLALQKRVVSLDPSRPVYSHASGSLGGQYSLNAYFNWAPCQERSDWLMAEIPDGSTSCTIAYQEYKTDGSKGDAYFVEAAL